MLGIAVIEIVGSLARTDRPRVIRLGQVAVEEALHVPGPGILGIVGQVPFDRGDGFHAPARLRQLRAADAPLHFRMYHQSELPGLKQDRLPVRVLGRIILRIENGGQLPGSPIECPLVNETDGPPVLHNRPFRRLLAEDEVEQVICFLQFRGRRFAL